MLQVREIMMMMLAIHDTHGQWHITADQPTNCKSSVMRAVCGVSMSSTLRHGPLRFAKCGVRGGHEEMRVDRD